MKRSTATAVRAARKCALALKDKAMKKEDESLLQTRNQGLTAEESAPFDKPTLQSLKAWLRPAVLIPFGLLVFLLMLLYLANQLHAGKALKRKDQLKTSIKELRAEFISIESDMMVRSRQSEVAQKLKEAGLKPLDKPPVKLEQTPKADGRK
jgi:hypothetical protein